MNTADIAGIVAAEQGIDKAAAKRVMMGPLESAERKEELPIMKDE